MVFQPQAADAADAAIIFLIDIGLGSPVSILPALLLSTQCVDTAATLPSDNRDSMAAIASEPAMEGTVSAISKPATSPPASTSSSGRLEISLLPNTQMAAAALMP